MPQPTTLQAADDLLWGAFLRSLLSAKETTECPWKSSKGSVPGAPSTPKAQAFQQLSPLALALGFSEH